MAWLLLLAFVAFCCWVVMRAEGSPPEPPSTPEDIYSKPKQFSGRGKVRFRSPSYEQNRRPGGEEAERIVHASLAQYGERVDRHHVCKLAGLTHANDDGTNRQVILKQCRPQELLALARVHDNPVDANAVAVARADGTQIGYVPARVASSLAPQMDKGSVWIAQLLQVREVQWGPPTALILLLRQTKPKNGRRGRPRKTTE